MATTYTLNYHLGKQEDRSDKFVMKVITDNMDIIDEQLKATDDKATAAAVGLKYKGAVNYYSDLPNDAEIGDAYTVLYAGSSGTVPDGTEYVWGELSGTAQWIDFSKDSYTKAEVNTLLAAKQATLTAGTGLSFGTGSAAATLGHSNSTTAQSTQAFRQVAYDAQGHITGSTAATTAQAAAINSGITSTDVEQINTNKNNISLLDSKVGVKNILGITLSGLKAVNSGTWTSRAIVINGVTFTYNIDGTITADGTAVSGGANLYLYRHRNVADYNYVGATLTGCPSGGGAETYGIFIEQESSPYGTFGADMGSGVTIADKASRDSYGMITIKGTVSNLTFSPMITHSSDLTFEAYSPTNRELYNDILTLQS